jgi:hypothetical protein
MLGEPMLGEPLFEGAYVLGNLCLGKPISWGAYVWGSLFLGEPIPGGAYVWRSLYIGEPMSWGAYVLGSLCLGEPMSWGAYVRGCLYHIHSLLWLINANVCFSVLVRYMLYMRIGCSSMSGIVFVCYIPCPDSLCLMWTRKGRNSNQPAQDRSIAIFYQSAFLTGL